MAKNSLLEEIRRNQIVEAALKVVAREGYYNLNMEKVAKEAKMSKGGIAHYFKSKKELFRCVFIKFFENIFDRSNQVLANISDPIEKLLSFVWLYNGDDPDVFKGYPILFDFMSIASRDEDFREIFQSWIESWIKLLIEILKEAQDLEILSPDLKREEMARVISALYQGVGERWYLDRENHSTNWAITQVRNAIYGFLGPYLLKV